MSAGFPAVIQHLESTGVYDSGFHLSSSAGDMDYISVYLDADELPAWFGEEVAALLVKLNPEEGVHCRLMPHFDAPLSENEIDVIAEHDASSILTLDDLRSRI